MNLRALILLISIAGNLLLAAVIIRQDKTSETPDTTSTNSTQTSPAKIETTGAEQATTDNNGAVVTATSENAETGDATAFRWSQLEAADYKEYIARLRAFGVPERVVRDIIIADVTKLFRPRFAALRPAKKPANQNFWENRNYSYSSPDRDMTKEQRAQTTALRKEQMNLIKELLGADVYEQISKESGYPDYTERMYGKLDKEQRDKISEMTQKFQEEQSAIYAKADGYVDQDTQKELEALRKKHRGELASVLTPEQLEEYELRSSQTAQQMRWELSSFEPDEGEFRAIHNYKQAMDDLKPVRGEDDKPPTAEEQKAFREKQKLLDESLANTLGTNRLAEYKLMSNYEYRNLFDAGVPKETVMKIPDIKKETESAASKIRNDKSLTQEQKNEALKAIKAETTKALGEMLGDRRAKYYQQNGGWWLRNLAPSEDQ